MKISEVFSSVELSDEDKVAAIAEIVKRARTNYGNLDLETEVPQVDTINGQETFSDLSNESKLVIAESEVDNIKIVAREFCYMFELGQLEKKVEELIAISPILTNLDKVGTQTSYI